MIVRINASRENQERSFGEGTSVNIDFLIQDVRAAGFFSECHGEGLAALVPPVQRFTSRINIDSCHSKTADLPKKQALSSCSPSQMMIVFCDTTKIKKCQRLQITISSIRRQLSGDLRMAQRCARNIKDKPVSRPKDQRQLLISPLCQFAIFCM